MKNENDAEILKNMAYVKLIIERDTFTPIICTRKEE